MKALKTVLLCLFILYLFSFPVFAESENEFYAEQYKNSGADELEGYLPDGARDFFAENGIDPQNYSWVDSLSPEGVFEHIWDFISSGAARPLRAGAGILAIILISAALSSLEIKGGAYNSAIYVSAAAAAAVVAVPIASLINASVAALKGTGVFMLSFIPVFAVIVAASGAAVTSASMSALLLAASEGVAYISDFAVLPLMGGYLAISISSAVSPIMKRSGLAEIIKKLSLWIMALISTVFVGVLGIQTAVNSAADTLASKTAKFVIGTSIPVAGGTLSEAMNTVTASMGLLKSSVGIYGVIACIVIFLPLLAELLIWRGILLLSSAASELFSLSSLAGLLKAIDSMLSVIVGIILLTAAIFIISLSVVVTGVKTV